MEQEPLTEQYLKTLTEKEFMAYKIAKDHLGSSFELEKSNGFIKWTAKQTAEQSTQQNTQLNTSAIVK